MNFGMLVFVIGLLLLALLVREILAAIGRGVARALRRRWYR